MLVEEWSTDLGVANFDQIDLVYNIAKSLTGDTGLPAKLITLSADSQSFIYNDWNGTYNNANVEFLITGSNMPNETVAIVANSTAAFQAMPASYSLNSNGQVSVSISSSEFDAAIGLVNDDFIEFTAEHTGGASDTITIFKLTEGSDVLNGYLTIENVL